MSEFEQKLSRSLRKLDPPAGFAQRVMDATGRQPKTRRLLQFPMRRAWIGSIAASLLLGALLAGGVERLHRSEERARAEQDFARSMQITDRVMERTRQRIQRAGVALDD